MGNWLARLIFLQGDKVTVDELRRLVSWCNLAEDNAGFWRRFFYAAYAYDERLRLLLQGFVAQYGTLPEKG